ncbi:MULTISPECIES: peptidylprolyl isomerase [Methylocystis]|uniref:Peptidyl-prolyl cis-trans isomerase n=1 Tax=Methylocystis iwaonis TaxID=2885079 RepID=A0ABM8E8S3_9HYPH|nr:MULTISPECIES: peptidylprolyl isomerase [Methylocystis]MBL1256239.1 peptidylprolyl isomerase [Methylocystis sp. Sn-Cys]MDJ0448057.1 peptidylprolyl isomerase [Methylocystis sp. JR02]BDV34378.1 peptidyl-prolyl cis-trans isomerase [Methylocystis iwaonis]
MKLTRRLLLATVAFSAALGTASIVRAEDELLYLDTKDGRVTIKLRPDLAPKHVERIKRLAKEHFYDGIVFHRVIDGFMAQAGDPEGTGMGSSRYPDLKAEFSDLPFKRGTVAMARQPGDKDSANSQFFICYADAPQLQGKYTIWGEVISGMDVVDKIKKGDKSNNGMVVAPDKIVKMRAAGDES